MSSGASTGGRPPFADLALDAFRFLRRMGFGVVHRESTLVRLESDRVFVNLYHGRSSFQVGLELGRLDKAELYSLYEVLTAFAAGESGRAGYQAVDADVLERCLRAIAETIRRDCADLLKGKDAAFETLRATASASREANTLQAQYGAILDQADQAWLDKDRDRAADLYEAAAPALDQTRRRRLAFARGKQTSG